jgi:hypothetical protein
MLGDELGHQAQGVGALGQLGEVVHLGDHRQQGVRVGLRQGLRQVAAHLGVGERQQQQGAVGVGAGAAALLAGEVVALVAQGAEVVGAAGDDELDLGCCRVRGGGVGPGPVHMSGQRRQAQQLAGEDLAVRLLELHQGLVQAVEDDHGA